MLTSRSKKGPPIPFPLRRTSLGKTGKQGQFSKRKMSQQEPNLRDEDPPANIARKLNTTNYNNMRS